MTLPHDRSRLLVDDGFPTKIFSESMDRWTETMLADDNSGQGSLNNLVKAKLIAKENGIICGQLVINRLLDLHAKNCSYDWKIQEGNSVKEKEDILHIVGKSTEILRVERVVLNLLGRLSGIATKTAEWVSTTDNIQFACTRKTEWGILDKWAVHVGGGLTHRLYRSDALMLKENDFASVRKIGENQTIKVRAGEEFYVDVDISDKFGNVLVWQKAGSSGFKGSRKSTAYAATLTAQKVAEVALSMGIISISVEVKGPGAGRESAIRALAVSGLQITSIKDVTPLPHNGCRPPKRRRV